MIINKYNNTERFICGECQYIDRRPDDTPPMPSTTTLLLLATVTLFIIGIVTGWVAGRRRSKSIKSRLQLIVGLIVTIVWVVSIAAEIVIPTYTVSILIHGIMGAVVGYLFSEDGITINIGSD